MRKRKFRSKDPWRCEKCGSLSVQQRAWIDPNYQEIVRIEDCDKNDYYCADCEENHSLIRESELLSKAVDKWWCETDFRAMECITGYRQLDFDPANGYQTFVDACNRWWNDKTTYEKINIYFENK